MLLASVKEIRDQLGFDDMTDINDAIIMALSAAEPQLSARLNTSFEQGEHTDTFWVPEPTFRSAGHNRTEFRMTHGFISKVVSVTATENSFRFSDTPTLPGDLASVMHWNMVKGVARDWVSHYSQQTVEFKYTHGFPADEADPRYYDLSVVPDWLQQAARVLALIHLAGHPSLTEMEIKLDVRMLTAQYEALIKLHVRYAPVALLPM